MKIKAKDVVGSMVASCIGKVVLLIIMYGVLKGLYVNNEYLTLIITIIAMKFIDTFKIELKWK